MSEREVIDFDRVGFCQKCGRRWGDHLTDYALRVINPIACRFVAATQESIDARKAREERARKAALSRA